LCPTDDSTLPATEGFGDEQNMACIMNEQPITHAVLQKLEVATKLLLLLLTLTQSWLPAFFAPDKLLTPS
jgi:hypothetical protein